MEKEYTFILPCLNEEKTLEYCIKEIQKNNRRKKSRRRNISIRQWKYRQQYKNSRKEWSKSCNM